MLHINSTKIRYRFLIETDKIVYRYQCIVRVFSCIGVHLVAVLLLLEEAIMTCVWIMTTICGESLGDETDKIILSAYTPSISLLPTGNTTLKQLFSYLNQLGLDRFCGSPFFAYFSSETPINVLGFRHLPHFVSSP